MALTITNKRQLSLGNRNGVAADITFDSSYAFGGESFNPRTLFGIPRSDIVIVEPKGGYTFEFDRTNNKLKAYAPAPPIVFEETVTVTSNVGTLKYPAAYIMYVGVGNEGYKVIPGALTPVTKSVAVSEPAWGTRPTLTFKATDSVSSCKVTYITQAWKEVFDNYVLALITAGTRVSGHASLTFTAGTPDVINLGENACLIEAITWNDNGTIKPMKALYKGETAATTEATIDFTDTADTSISVLETDTLDAATDSVYIRYIRKPAAGFLADRFIEEDDLTPSSDVVTLSSGLAVGSNALIFGSCGDFAGPTTKFANIISAGGTVGTGATLIQPTTVLNTANTFTLGSNHSDSDHLKPSYICGQPWEIPNLVPIEVENGRDLSDVTVRVVVMGGW
jgi:hypothetical protein